MPPALTIDTRPRIAAQNISEPKPKQDGSDRGFTFGKPDFGLISALLLAGMALSFSEALNIVERLAVVQAAWLPIFWISATRTMRTATISVALFDVVYYISQIAEFEFPYVNDLVWHHAVTGFVANVAAVLIIRIVAKLHQKRARLEASGILMEEIRKRTRELEAEVMERRELESRLLKMHDSIEQSTAAARQEVENARLKSERAQQHQKTMNARLLRLIEQGLSSISAANDDNDFQRAKAIASDLMGVVTSVISVFDDRQQARNGLAISVDKIDFIDVIEQAIESAAGENHDFGVDWVKPSVTVSSVGDHDRLTRAIAMIIRALHHAAHGNAELYVRIVPLKDTIRLMVIADGWGDSSLDSQTFFGPFLFEAAGFPAGVALHQARGLIAAHGGSAEAVSRPAEGTTVTISLPVNSVGSR
jgi:hypothetical protein